MEELEIKNFWDSLSDRSPEYASVGAASIIRDFYGDYIKSELGFSLLDNVRGKSAKVLDLGCGWGRLLVRVARISDAVGVDVSFSMLKRGLRHCRSMGVQADVVLANMTRLPFRPHSFDVAYSYLVLQHLPRRVMLKAIEDAYEVIRRSGLFLGTLPYKYGLDGISAMIAYELLGLRSFWGPAKTNYYSMSEILPVFTRLFESVTIEPWEFRPPWLIVRGKPLYIKWLARWLRKISKSLQRSGRLRSAFLRNFCAGFEVKGMKSGRDEAYSRD